MLEFTKEQKNQIEELYKSGMNIRKVSKELKINSGRVNDYLRELGALRTTRLTKDELDVLRNKIKELYLSGKRISEIEKEINLSHNAIQKHLKDSGVKLRSYSEDADIKFKEYIEEVIRLYNSGLSPNDIGKKIGKAGRTIHHLLVKAGVEIRKNNKIDDKKFQEMWKQGATDDEFMKEFNCARATIRGYRLRHNCHVTQWFSQTEQSLSEIQEQMVLGSLLGDLNLRKQKNGTNCNLALVHCISQKELFMKKVEILDEFMGAYRLCNKTPDKRTRKVYLGYRGHSKSHPVFNNIYNILYPNDIKTITQEYLDMIHHPIALAYWFMDDGSRNGVIATNSFSLEECKMLQKMLLNKFNIYTTLQKNKENYIVYIISESRKEFDDLVRPYIIDSMKYKLRYL